MDPEDEAYYSEGYEAGLDVMAEEVRRLTGNHTLTGQEALEWLQRLELPVGEG